MDLLQYAASGGLEVLCAALGRFYGEGVTWALHLRLSALMRWRDLVPKVRAADPLADAVWVRRPPQD